MSLNRFESMAPLWYAKSDQLASGKPETARAVTVVLDIFEGWAMAAAVPQVAAALDALASDRAALFLRIGLPDDSIRYQALEKLAALRPAGFVLAGCGDVTHIQKLDGMLRVAEAECGMTDGALPILAEVGAQPAFFLSSRSLSGISQRLQGIVFDAQALTRATGSQAVHAATGQVGAPLLFARAAIVLKARQAGLVCHELLASHDLPDDDLRDLQDAALGDGFSSVVARNTAQIRALYRGE